jgi:hypothetical protein
VISRLGVLALVVVAAEPAFACRRSDRIAPARAASSGPRCPAVLAETDTAAGTAAAGAALLDRGRRLGGTESATVALLGPQPERQVDTVTNRYDGQVDSIVRLRYPGLEVAFYKVTAGGAEILGAVTLSSAGCEVLPGLGVGAAATILPTLFGPPVFRQAKADTLILQFAADSDAAPKSYLNFAVVHGTIRHIQWQFDID